jgi:hypothetical protein
MKSAEQKLRPEAVQRLLLARLSVQSKRAPSQKQLIAEVAKALSPPQPTAAVTQAVERELSRSVRAGLIDGAPPALTKKAHALIASWFGSKRARSWKHAQQRVALSFIGRDAPDRVLHQDELAAIILGAQRDVPVTIRKLPEVVDYLCWRALGVESRAAFDARAVQRYLLRDLVPADVRSDQRAWRRMLAMRASGATGHDPSALTRALWSRSARKPGKRSRTISARANDNAPLRALEPTLADFAAAVRAAARSPNVTRFHDDRAFIGSIWEQMHERNLLRDMTLDEFKQRLIQAHRDGLLRITRADLVSAMDPEEVERSEARYQDATFHFVALEAGGDR